MRRKMRNKLMFSHLGLEELSMWSLEEEFALREDLIKKVIAKANEGDGMRQRYVSRGIRKRFEVLETTKDFLKEIDDEKKDEK